MFGWIDFRGDGKKKWEIWEKIGEKSVWLKERRGRKLVRLTCLFSAPTEASPNQIGKKNEGGNKKQKSSLAFWTKLPSILKKNRTSYCHIHKLMRSASHVQKIEHFVFFFSWLFTEPRSQSSFLGGFHYSIYGVIPINWLKV